VARPIVFLSDYGFQDEYVGVCHGVIARIAPDAPVVDLTHAVPPHDVLRGALVLAASIRYMPGDAVYIAVVDPGVGTIRKGVAVRTASGADLVGPDNGLLAPAWEGLGGAVRAAEITSERVLLRPVSPTFHGRDVFAPAAAHLATGMALEELGPDVPVDDLARLWVPEPDAIPDGLRTSVLAVDRFGNVQLAARPNDLEAAGLADASAVRVSTTHRSLIVPRVRTFADLAQGQVGLSTDSAGFLALVVNLGSAAFELGLEAGSEVVLARPG
jgi:S-adenosyl-L-methionine hydrolase (adenosine-forming)